MEKKSAEIVWKKYVAPTRIREYLDLFYGAFLDRIRDMGLDDFVGPKVRRYLNSRAEKLSRKNPGQISGAMIRKPIIDLLSDRYGSEVVRHNRGVWDRVMDQIEDNLGRQGIFFPDEPSRADLATIMGRNP